MIVRTFEYKIIKGTSGNLPLNCRTFNFQSLKRLLSIYCLNMKYRNPKKDNDLFSMIDHQQEVMRTVKGINKLNAVIDWSSFEWIWKHCLV